MRILLLSSIVILFGDFFPKAISFKLHHHASANFHVIDVSVFRYMHQLSDKKQSQVINIRWLIF